MRGGVKIEGYTARERVALLACGVFLLLFLWVAVLAFGAASTGATVTRKHRTTAPEAAPKVRTGAQLCTEVDVVYLWVNGSDPAHRREMLRHGYGWDGGYRDYGVLKYSARSVAEFMPWVRNIVLVTNGQVPDWVDPAAPRLRLVTHREIFEHAEDLPTFNSNAIEANLRNIPGLAPCFLYMNDDMFLGAPVRPAHFFDRHGNLRVHMSGSAAPNFPRMRENLWHASVGNTNAMLNRFYYPTQDPYAVPHMYVQHTCYFMRTDILRTIAARWKPQLDATCRHRFRHANDTAMPFLQANVALEEFGARAAPHSTNHYGVWTPDARRNTAFWQSIWARPHACVCMNDNLDNSPSSKREIRRLEQLFEHKFPRPSFIEKQSPS